MQKYLIFLICCITYGLLLQVIFVEYRTENIRISFANEIEDMHYNNETDNPTQIIIPSVGLKKYLAEGHLANDTWTVYKNRLSFIKNNEKTHDSTGNIIVYGHAIKSQLHDLKFVKIDDEIRLKYPDKILIYKVISSENILPDETDKITSLGETQLSIFTCDGPKDEYRKLVKAKLIETIELNLKEVI